MARPKTKADLLNQSEANFNKLLAHIDSLAIEEQSTAFPSTYLNRNIRDVLGHLHHWHSMVQDWYQVGMTGEQPAMPAKGYTWKTTPALNRVIQEKYSTIPLAEVRTLLEGSYADVRQLIEQHTDKQLFTKRYYKWTGTTSLGAYLISATASHYDWALKLVKKCLRKKTA